MDWERLLDTIFYFFAPSISALFIGRAVYGLKSRSDKFGDYFSFGCDIVIAIICLAVFLKNML